MRSITRWLHVCDSERAKAGGAAELKALQPGEKSPARS